MSSRIESRPLTSDERTLLTYPNSPLARNLPGTILRYLLLAGIALLVLMVAELALSALARQLPNGVEPRLPARTVRVLHFMAYAAVFLMPLPGVLRSHRRRMSHDRARQDDLDGGVAEIVDIEGIDATRLMLEHQPVLCFDLDLDQGLDRRLLLHGDWVIWDFDTFGLPEPEPPDDDLEWGSTLPFPNTHFVVHRLPHSGDVLRVELLGTATDPPRDIVASDPALEAALHTLRVHDRRQSMLVPARAASTPHPISH